MVRFSGNVLMANGDIIPVTEYMIRDMETNGTRADYAEALEEMRRGEVRSPAAAWMYDAAKRNRFPTLTEVAGRNSHAVRMHAVAMLEEILAVWPVEVAP
jgi:hypothetical protein